MSQITDDLGHEWVWKLGEKKEDDEGFRFTSYLHRGCIMVVELIHGWRTEARCESN